MSKHSKSASAEAAGSVGPRARRLLLAGVVSLGFAAMTTQLVLLRETMSAFSGNELVLGIALGSWLLLTGIGSRAGKFAREHAFPLFLAGLAVVAIAAPAEVAALRVLRNPIFGHGITVGPEAVTLAVVAAFTPFCLASGAMLTMGATLVGETGPGVPVAKVYVADTLGSLFGGTLFSLLLVGRVDHFAALLLPASLALVAAAALAWQSASRAWALVFVALLLPLALALLQLDAVTTAIQYPSQDVLLRAQSPYGRVVVARASGQTTFFGNGSPSIASAEQSEEAAHYAMAQRPQASKVLVITSGISGAPREVARYASARVVHVDPDPLWQDLVRRFEPSIVPGPKVATLASDPRRFVRGTGERFDVIILDTPDPSTAQLNRLYTHEFFQEAKRALAAEGVLAFGISRYENFVGPGLASIVATVSRTLHCSFANVMMIPGNRIFFLASDGPLTGDIAGALEANAIPTKYVNRHSLGAILAPDRAGDLVRAAAAPAEINSDANPALEFLNLKHWQSQFGGAGAWVWGIVGSVGLVLFVRFRPIPRMVFAAGGAASALEVVILLGFQVLYGALYREVGMLVTIFMAGMAFGAWGATRFPAISAARAVRFSGLLIALFAGLLPFAFPAFRWLDRFHASSGAAYVGFFLVAFFPAVLVGAQFSFASVAVSGDSAARAASLFSADLLGASLSAFLASAWLIPAFGVAVVCASCAALNLVAALVFIPGTEMNPPTL